MTRDEHIERAEQLLAQAADRQYNEERTERYELAAALAHATLAVALSEQRYVTHYTEAGL